MLAPPGGRRVQGSAMASASTFAAAKRRGGYCSAYGCSNCKSVQVDLSFFRFPKNKERCKRWVINSRRQDLMNKTPEYLYNSCRICSDHFTQSQFMNTKKNSLVWNAVPTLFPTSKSHIRGRKPPKVRIPCVNLVSPQLPREKDVSSTTKCVLSDHTYTRVHTSMIDSGSQHLPADGVKLIAGKVVELQQQLQKVTSSTPGQEKKSIEEVIQGARDLGMQDRAARFFEGQLRNCECKSKDCISLVHIQ